jgi:hypothetical protein
MNELDREWKSRLAWWRIEPPEAGLADRIVARAVAQPQDLPFGIWLRQVLMAGFSEWRVGLQVKVASLTLCAVLGFSIGLYQASDPVDVEVAGVAFGESSFEGEI